MSGIAKVDPLTPPSPFWADLQSPLADRLAVLWCADGNYEIMSRKFGILSGSSPPVLGVGAVGKIMIFPGGAASVSYIDFGVNPVHADIAKGSPCTFFACGALVYNSNHTFACHSDNNATNAGWLFGGSPSASQVLIERASSNISVAGSSDFDTTDIATQPFRTWAITHDGLNTTGSSTAYINGRQGTASASAGSGIQGSDSTRNLYIGGNNSGLLNACMNGGLKMVAVWRRILQPAELAALHADPLLLYRQPRRMRNRVAGLASAGALANRPAFFICN